MKPRRLWASVIVMAVLAGASLALWFGGTRPVLGLDLEGGVSVILSAPAGTTPDVMDKALENIRTRIDAFGTAEPQLLVSGTNIEVQIPGVAGGQVVETPRENPFALEDATGTSFGTFADQATADAVLADATVKEIVTQVCLASDLFVDQPQCFRSVEEATAAIDGITIGVPPTPEATGSPTAAVGPPGSATETTSLTECLLGTGLVQAPCYATRAEAQAALDGITVGAPTYAYCLRSTDDAPVATPGSQGCYQTKDEADGILASLNVVSHPTKWCVVSSAGARLGCFPDRADADAKLKSTGQDRLLEVIGQTARLEQRKVLQTLAPGDATYDANPVTCALPTEQDTEACTPEALATQTVWFLGEDGQTKYELGEVLVTGDAIDKATAVYSTGTNQSVGTGWQIDFTLTSEGSDIFSQVTTELQGQQLAIVVDNVVLSAPTVQSAITGGSGVITGSFDETRAKELATQLNAGALPVALDTQQVLTVSPTLGKASLREGLIAAIAGLVALALYLLFYYRLLGVVAFFGMATWAALALALVAIAGSTIGYTLTLAGVAGLVISIGVTADSYIVFFERLKDEVRGGRSPRAAVQPAFKRAYRTIVAADVVTALAAVVLYITAVSSVRGFALTLGVSTALDLFVVYFFKRPIVFLIARNERLVNLRGFGLTSGVAADPVAAEGAR